MAKTEELLNSEQRIAMLPVLMQFCEELLISNSNIY